MDDPIYRQELMEIYKDPAHRGHMANETAHYKGTNPMCGDEITLQVQITDGVVTDAKFDGEACAVSIISSELLTEHIIGKPVTEAKAVTKAQLLDLIGINLTTSRVKCATLALSALQGALENQ